LSLAVALRCSPADVDDLDDRDLSTLVELLG